MLPARLVTPLALSVLLLLSRPALASQRAAQEQRALLQRLSDAVSARDTGAFLEAYRALLGSGEPRNVRPAVEAYARFAEQLAKKGSWSDLYHLHDKSAASFSSVSQKAAIAEVARLRLGSRDWRARLLCLDAAAFNPTLDLEEACLSALADKSPYVVRRALRYLANSRKVPVVEKIVERYNELAAKKPLAEAAQWERTLLAFQGALQQMLRVDLPAAADWKNYVDAHKHRPDFLDPEKRIRDEGGTAITLFGAAVTGKNIAIILDVSGSMMATDPPPEGEEEERRGRTVVGDPARRGIPLPREDRRRMHRAKRELARVIRALPEDVQFNVIAYSSEVKPWRRSMAAATVENKAAAVEFVEGLEAEGITVTDMALEDAFSDLALDTIYLITDGAPTHTGSTGPGKPPDADEIIAEIHRRVKELNFLRDVRIFTLGFEGAEEDFLKKLSADNGGRYVRIR
jgi:hypothetical protein